MTTTDVLAEVAEERERQEQKWGQQNHPDGTGPRLLLPGIPTAFGLVQADMLEAWAKARTDHAFRVGFGTYEQILTEEWAEAITAADPVKLRTELVQVAAVAVAWCEKIDRAQ